MRRLAPLLLLAVFAGCGSDDGDDLNYELRTPPPYVGGVSVPPKGQKAVDRRMTRSDADRYRGVIDAWADSVRRGDVTEAAGYFDLPAVVHQRGASALQVNTPEIAAAFNASLTCGAKLIGTKPDGRYVVGTFVLVSVGTTRCEDEGDVSRVGFVFGHERHPRRFTEWWQAGASDGDVGPGKRPTAVTPATVSDFT